MTRDEVLAAIARERARLRLLVDRLAGDADRRTVTEEGWTAHDVLAHCIHWAGQLAFGLGAPMHPPAWVEAAGGATLDADGWNARVVAHYRGMPLEIVVRDFDRVADAVVERLRTKSDADLNAEAKATIPWAPAGEPLWKSVASETFEHWPDHSDDLERALEWGT